MRNTPVGLRGSVSLAREEYPRTPVVWLLTSGQAQTAPPFIPIIIGEGGLDWPAVAAGTTLFLLPVVIFTVLLRDQLLRGITFGAVRK